MKKGGGSGLKRSKGWKGWKREKGKVEGRKRYRSKGRKSSKRVRGEGRRRPVEERQIKMMHDFKPYKQY